MATRAVILDPLHDAAPGAHRPINVGSIERWITGLGGAGLTVLGLRRRSPAGMAAAAVGGALVERAFTGHCPAYAVLGVSTVDAPRSVNVTQSVLVARERAEVY